MNIRPLQVLVSFLVLLSGAAVVGQTQAPQMFAPSVDRVGFPKGYREQFKKLFTLDRADVKQVRVVYGNELAAQVPANGMFPYGSVLVMEIYNAKLDALGNPVLSSEGRYRPAELVSVLVQRKEQGFGVDYGSLRNGEWEFGSYKEDGTYLRQPNETGACAECHFQAGSQRDYAFRTAIYRAQASGAQPDGVLTQYAYVPRQLTVQAGQTVTWYNLDEVAHTISSVKGEGRSGDLKTGQSWSHRFDQPGEYEFACEHHPGMKLKVTVK